MGRLVCSSDAKSPAELRRGLGEMGEFPAEEEEEVELLRSRVAFAADESMLRVCVIWV